MKKIFFYIAVAGWIAGLAVTLLSFSGVDVADKFPYVWVLHVAIFVVWFPAIYTLIKNNKSKRYGYSKESIFEFYKSVFRNSSKWLIIIAICSFIYCSVNFALYAHFYLGMPDIMNSEYALHEHGSILKVLTEDEYHYYNAKQLNAFSGVWLVFYGIAAAILYPFNKSKDIVTTPTI